MSSLLLAITGLLAVATALFLRTERPAAGRTAEAEPQAEAEGSKSVA